MEPVSASVDAARQWNCAFSVEPVSASVDDAPAVTTVLTASK